MRMKKMSEEKTPRNLSGEAVSIHQQKVDRAYYSCIDG